MNKPQVPARSGGGLKMAAGFVAPYKKVMLAALLALIFTAGITLSIGQGIRLLIDDGFVTRSPEQLNRTVALFFGLVVALAAGTFTRFYCVSWLGERVVADIRRRVFDHLLELHPGFFESNRSLEIQSRFTADTTLLQSVIGSSVSIALRNVIMLVGGIILLFITNAKLTAIVMLAVPLVVAPILIFGRRVRNLSRKSQDHVAGVGSYVGETLMQIKTVQAYNHQAVDRERFAAVVEGTFAVAKQRVAQRSLMMTVVIVLVLGAVGGMLWVGGQDVIAGRITGGELAAFVFYAIIVGGAVGAISEVIGELQRAAGASDRIFELLQSSSEITAPTRDLAALPVPATGHLRLEDVSFAYASRPETLALNALNFEVHPGETLALVGPSGAGKSTLFDLLLRFFDPQTGAIYMDGCNIRDVEPASLRQRYAYVSQQAPLFYGTVEENIRYGKPGATISEVEAAAQAANAHAFIMEMPQGYQTHLGDAGIGLSGGQKQRIAIARAILVDAPVLLLDEATSALDAQSEYLVQEALDRLMKGRTTLVIAHRLATVKNADRIAVIDHGRLLAIGKHQELMKTNPLYARLAELQFHDGERAVGTVGQ